MGNQGSVPKYFLPNIASTHFNQETLESSARQESRVDNLRNMDTKHTKSLRRSISKRFSKKKLKIKETRELDSHIQVALSTDTAKPCSEISGSSTKLSVDKTHYLDTRKDLETANYNAGKPAQCQTVVVGEPDPFPSYVQNFKADASLSTKLQIGRLRKSLRSSFNIKSLHQTRCDRQYGGNEASNKTDIKTSQWLADEISVRSGTCSFEVKYLGSIEVSESRGMQVCEEAVRTLKNSRRKPVRAILYIHGDGLCVVEDETKGLIVDQTIEKVSFCAPDRNFERGFSYICRDGTTRRWVCHGFLAVNEMGERLSHAVGCAFAICLERKQERDLFNITVSVDSSNVSFIRHENFKQITIEEKFQDPQVSKPSFEQVSSNFNHNPFAVSRPQPSATLMQRASLRGFQQLRHLPFKRQLSLHLEKITNQEQQQVQDSFKNQHGILDSTDEKDKLKISNSNAVSNIDNDDVIPENEHNTNNFSSNISSQRDSINHYYLINKKNEVHVSAKNLWDFVPDQPLDDDSLSLPTLSLQTAKRKSPSIVLDKLILGKEISGFESKSNILDDPFDDEWATMAAKNSSSSKIMIENKSPRMINDSSKNKTLPSFEVAM